MLRNSDLISGLFWAAVGVGFCFGALEYGLFRSGKHGAGFFPFLAGMSLVLLSSCMFVSALKERKKGSHGKERFFPEKDSGKKILFALMALIGYGFTLPHLGFLLTTFFFIFLLMKLVEPQKWISTLTTAFLVTVLSYLVFEVWLKVQLPRGIVGI